MRHDLEWARLRPTGGRGVAALLTALVGLCGFAVPQANATDVKPAGPAVTGLAAIVQPAVQLITTEYRGEVIVEDPVANRAALLKLQDALWAQQRRGTLANDLQSLNRQWLAIWASNTGKYSKPTNRRIVKVAVKTQCSGWFATPDGYLVTGAHCVAMSRSEQLEAFKAKVLPALIEKDYKDTLKDFRKVPLDQGMLSDMHQISEDFYERRTKLSSTSTTVQIALAVKGKTLERDTKNVPAEVVSAGKAYPERDVALLKVNGFERLPSLALGDEKRLQVGDRLFVSGFPGSVSGNADFSTASRKEPTFTEGLLNASRVTAKGVPYLQTQAPATYGNSGGPVLDESGKVIGILIAGSVDQNTGTLVAGQEFVLPASEVVRQLSERGLKATADPVTTPYSAALSDYSRSYYKRALEGFTRVNEMFPSHPYAEHYVNLAQQRIRAGDDQTPSELPWKWMAIGIIATILILAVIALVVLRRRRRRAVLMGVAPALGVPAVGVPAGTDPMPVAPSAVTAAGAVPAGAEPAGDVPQTAVVAGTEAAPVPTSPVVQPSSTQTSWFGT